MSYGSGECFNFCWYYVEGVSKVVEGSSMALDVSACSSSYVGM
jgi:hypothetical protein